MKFLIVAVIILVLLAILVFSMGHVEYDLYIKHLSETKTIEEIDKKINDDIDILNKGHFKGHILENIRDHKELWEQVKEYKLTGKLK